VILTPANDNGRTLKPFWRYYGGKYRAAPHYPRPQYETIIEPFAGSAGYSMRYPDRRVILVEKYPVIAGIWRYLIGASAQEIRDIPCVDHVDDLPSWVPQEARWLVGFAMNDAATRPMKTMSAGLKMLRSRGRKFGGWGEGRRDRVASQVDRIKHWRVIEGDYWDAPAIEATWFIDPPYVGMGKYYVHGSDSIDYAALGKWCRGLPGQVLVCENTGADWLPFVHLGSFRSGPRTKTSSEAIWMKPANDNASP
jgi:hypothetical protein